MSSEYAVLCNMYYQKSIKHESMATLKTKNYIIEIEREDVSKEFLNLQYKYRCILRFKDLLGREVRQLVFNEAQASVLTDNIGMFIYDNYSDMVVLSNINSTSIFESYSLALKETEINGDFSILFQILCYNSFTQMMQPVLTTTLSLEEMDNLCNMMFFIYLIDLVSDREGIFKT